MKIKTLLPALILAIVTPSVYAAGEVLWLNDAKKDVQAEQQPQLPADKPQPALQLPVDEQALVGKSVAEIVAFAAANPDYAVDIALAAVLAAKDSEQATLITRALIAKFPDQADAIKAQLANAYAQSPEYAAAINSKVLYSEAVIDPQQDTVNNIQASANQGKISQKLANLLIAAIVLSSGGSVIAPTTPPSPS